VVAIDVVAKAIVVVVAIDSIAIGSNYCYYCHLICHQPFVI